MDTIQTAQPTNTIFEKLYLEGKALRAQLSRKKQSALTLPGDRLSVPQAIELSNYDRLPDLIPVRHGRMSKSPFTFYRATASLMAADLAVTANTGIIVQASGDCHLMNFGGFATPERNLVLDLNDFDETIHGPWEWDLKRLATSFVLAAREKGFSPESATEICMELTDSYRDKLSEFSQMKLMDFWHYRFDIERFRQDTKDEQISARLTAAINKANKQTHDRVFYKITSSHLGTYSISDQPPLVMHPLDVHESMAMINAFIDHYRSTLQPDRRWLLDQYKVIDVALKVVGVGSVGTRCYVLLMMNQNNEPLILQCKEARTSVLAAYVGKSQYEHNGERVVQGQRFIQAASDIFLGWATGPSGRQFYFRQLRDKKLSADVESFDKNLLTVYARLCGRILARAHCRTGKGAHIAGYIGKSDVFGETIAKFGVAYADQTEKDYDEFMKAIRAGRLPIQLEA